MQLSTNWPKYFDSKEQPEVIPTLDELQRRIQKTLPYARFTQDMIERKAIKLRHRLMKGDRIADAFSIVFLSELSQDEKLLDRAAFNDRFGKDAHLRRKARRRTRHFKNCKQCGTRFLAKRVDQDFHSPKCRVRWNRSHPQCYG